MSKEIKKINKDQVVVIENVTQKTVYNIKDLEEQKKIYEEKLALINEILNAIKQQQ